MDVHEHNRLIEADEEYRHKGQESRVRSKAIRAGYHVYKSRERKHVPNIDNYGEFMLTDDRNGVVLGSRYDASLDEIEEYLKGKETGND